MPRRAKTSAHSPHIVPCYIEREIQKLKAGAGPDIVVLGSGSIVSQLTQARLVDAYQVVVIPVVLGQGRTLFETVHDRRDLKLTKWKNFTNGNVVLWYEPV